MAKKQFGERYVPMMDGGEKFTYNDKWLGFTALDFWRFQYSNVWDYQGDVAEFLVAKALGICEPHNRAGWTLWDFDYKGKRIEVKSTAYFQIWEANGKITTEKTFRIRKTHEEQGGIDTPLVRNNDVYVFCLLKGETMETSHPFKIDNWRFWVIPTETINTFCDDNKTISLKRVKEIAKNVNGLLFGQLREKIDEEIAKITSKK